MNDFYIHFRVLTAKVLAQTLHNNKIIFRYTQTHTLWQIKWFWLKYKGISLLLVKLLLCCISYFIPRHKSYLYTPINIIVSSQKYFLALVCGVNVGGYGLENFGFYYFFCRYTLDVFYRCYEMLLHCTLHLCLYHRSICICVHT